MTVALAVVLVGGGSLLLRVLPLLGAARIPDRVTVHAGRAGMAVLAATTVRTVAQHRDSSLAGASVTAPCLEVAPSEPGGTGPTMPVWESQTDVEHVLQNPARIAAAGAQVERTLTGWVRHARSLGATWARIGESLGMTRQSAWERFAGEE